MGRNLKRIVSYVLAVAMLFSLNLSGVTLAGAETRGSNVKGEGSAAKTDPFEVMNFAALYEEGGVTCTAKKGVTFDTETVEGGLLVTGKSEVVSGAAISLSESIDFGDDAVSRIQINALAKRATKTYIRLYLDDSDKPFTEFRLANQAKEDNWDRQKIFSYEFSKKEKITGSHTIHIRINDTTTAEDKKTSVLLRTIQFVPESIPIVSFELDEELGSIADMNGDPEHSLECYGKMKITVPEGFAADFGDDPEKAAKDTSGSYALDYIRGRGNSTWIVDKKPYKIKLDKKADLFGMGENKHWVLLANYYDNSLLRNRLTYYLGRKLGMEYTPECVPVDVIMNNQYLGSYLLCEQIRLDKNRVDENNLEDAKEGDDLSGGYLLAMNPYGDETGKVIYTDRNEYYMESPEEGECVDDAAEYIEEYMQKTEDAIYSPDFCLEDGTSYTELMDVQSAIAYYWMQEFSMNGDAFISTSTYLYKKQDTEEEKGKLYWGPLWDFDYVAWASWDYSDDPDSYSGFMNQRTWFKRLMENPEFSAQVKDYWKTLKKELEAAIADGGILDQYAEQMSISAKSNYDLWGFYDFDWGEWWDDEEDSSESLAGKLTYTEEVERLKTWIGNRIEWVDGHLGAVAPAPITLTYTVGGKTYKTVEALSGRAITSLPEDPQAPEGYVFKGWYYMDEDGDKMRLREGDILMEDTELVAEWIPESELVEAESIQLERNKIYIVEGTCLNLNYVVLPLNVTDDTVTITSSDNKVVGLELFEDDWYYDEYESEYLWTAKSEGTATLTLTAANGVTATCEIEVISWEQYMRNMEDYYLEGYALDKTTITMKPGETQKINLELTPETAVAEFYWTSTDEEVAEVKGGTVIAKEPGLACILVYDNENGEMKYCLVTVEEETTPPASTPTPTIKPTATPKPTEGAVPTGTPAGNQTFNKNNIKYEVAQNGTAKVIGAVKSAKKVTIPDTVSYNNKKCNVTEISSKAFAGDKKLSTLIIGNKVTKIGSSAFEGCKKLKTLRIGKNVAKIEASAFKSCKGLKTVEVKGTKLKKVGKNAFKGIHKKAVVKVPKDKTKKYKKLFKGIKIKSQK